MTRASARTSRFWSSRSWNSSGMAADFSCWTSSQSGSIGGAPAEGWTGGSCASCGRWRAATIFDAGPIGFLVGRQLQPLLDAGDLDVAEKGVVLLHRRFFAAAFGFGGAAGAVAMLGAPMSEGAVEA